MCIECLNTHCGMPCIICPLSMFMSLDSANTPASSLHGCSLHTPGLRLSNLAASSLRLLLQVKLKLLASSSCQPYGLVSALACAPLLPDLRLSASSDSLRARTAFNPNADFATFDCLMHAWSETLLPLHPDLAHAGSCVCR